MSSIGEPSQPAPCAEGPAPAIQYFRGILRDPNTSLKAGLLASAALETFNDTAGDGNHDQRAGGDTDASTK